MEWKAVSRNFYSSKIGVFEVSVFQVHDGAGWRYIWNSQTSGTFPSLREAQASAQIRVYADLVDACSILGYKVRSS